VTVPEFLMGDPVEPQPDLFVQVFSYEQGDVGDSAFAAVDVEVCSTAARDGGMRVVAADFELVMPDNTRRQPTSTAAKQPAFTSATLESAGDCARGFVTFSVPRASTPAFVEYVDAEPAVRWAIGAEIEEGH
jgi:hypothetical protein